MLTSKLGAIDESIMRRMEFPARDLNITGNPNYTGSRTAFDLLVQYLKLLAEEVSLSGDGQFRAVLNRLRRVVETESGGRPEGVRVYFTGEEQIEYHAESMLFGPNPPAQEAAKQLFAVLDEVVREHNQSPDIDEGPDS